MIFHHTSASETLTHCWPLHGGLLVMAVAEAGETCVTLAVTTHTHIDSPGAALIELVKALSIARYHLPSERQARNE